MNVSDIALVERVREGDPEATTELYRRYIQRLLNVIGPHVATRFQGRFDPDDVCQSAMRSVFRLVRTGKFHFQNDEGLWKWIVTIGLNKMRNTIRYHSAEKRDPSCEISLDDEHNRADERFMERLGSEPTPEDAAAFEELMRRVLTQLPPLHQAVLQLRLEGCSQKEIAEKLQICDKSVRRYLTTVGRAIIYTLREEELARDRPTWRKPAVAAPRIAVAV